MSTPNPIDDASLWTATSFIALDEEPEAEDSTVQSTSTSATTNKRRHSPSSSYSHHAPISFSSAFSAATRKGKVGMGPKRFKSNVHGHSQFGGQTVDESMDLFPFGPEAGVTANSNAGAGGSGGTTTAGEGDFTSSYHHQQQQQQGVPSGSSTHTPVTPTGASGVDHPSTSGAPYALPPEYDPSLLQEAATSALHSILVQQQDRDEEEMEEEEQEEVEEEEEEEEEDVEVDIPVTKEERKKEKKKKKEKGKEKRKEKSKGKKKAAKESMATGEESPPKQKKSKHKKSKKSKGKEKAVQDVQVGDEYDEEQEQEEEAVLEKEKEVVEDDLEEKKKEISEKKKKRGAMKKLLDLPKIGSVFLPTSEVDESARKVALARAMDPTLSKNLSKTLSSHHQLYQLAYNALNDELIKIQIEESVLRNIKTAVMNHRALMRHSAK